MDFGQPEPCAKSPDLSPSRKEMAPKRKCEQDQRPRQANRSKKRSKIIGRPKNLWTQSRSRKLVRLYLMTDLEVAEIVEVLRSKGFMPCKRDVQKQLSHLLQSRPSQIRLRCAMTKNRHRLFRECRNMPMIVQTTSLPTSTGSLPDEGQDNLSSGVWQQDMLEDDRSWLDLISDDRLCLPEVDLQESYIFSDDYLHQMPERSHDPMLQAGLPIGSLQTESDVSPQISSKTLTDEQRHHQLPDRLTSDSDSGIMYLDIPKPLSDQNTPYNPPHQTEPYLPVIVSPEENMKGIPAIDVRELSEKQLCLSLEPQGFENTSYLNVAHEEDRGNESIFSTRSSMMQSSIRSITALKHRLSRKTESYLEEIMSVMQNFTISTPSGFLREKSRRRTTSLLVGGNNQSLPLISENDDQNLGYDEPNMLESFVEGPLPLPGDDAAHTVVRIRYVGLQRKIDPLWSPYSYASDACRTVHNPYFPGREPLTDNSISRICFNTPEKKDIHEIDIFGNSMLHIAASFGKYPAWIHEMIRRGANMHAINSAGETFLHRLNFDLNWNLEDVVSLFETLQNGGFCFGQRDVLGRPALHCLVSSWSAEKVACGMMIQLRDANLHFLPTRDSHGLTITKKTSRADPKGPTWIPPDYSVGQKSSPLASTSVLDIGTQLEAEGIQCLPNYTKHIAITTFDDLKVYEYHADLLRNIVKACSNPRHEDSSGRNGLHSLAEVCLTLPIPGAPRETENVSSTTCIARLSYLENLILAGVDSNNYDKRGVTPLMAFILYTRENEDDETTAKILTRLCEAGSQIELRNRQGESALHIAVKLGKLSATKFLLNRGANVHSRDLRGKGVVAVGHEASQAAKADETTYAQIMLCTSLVIDAGAFSAPTFLQEWTQKGSHRRRRRATSSTSGSGSVAACD